MLEELLRAGMRGDSPMTPSIPAIGMTVASGFGCLRRLVMVVFLLIMLAVFFFSGLLGFSGPAARIIEPAGGAAEPAAALTRLELPLGAGEAWRLAVRQPAIDTIGRCS